MEAIDVSPEMLTLVGMGALGDHRWPTSPVAFEFDFGSPATFRFHLKPSLTALDKVQDEVRMIFIVAHEACERLLGAALEISDAEAFFQARDRVADGRWRNFQLLGGRAKTSSFGNGGENDELGKLRAVH